MDSEIKENIAGYSRFLKHFLLAAIILLALVTTGCSNRQTTLKGQLAEIDTELQRSVTRILMEVDNLDYLVSELHYIDAAFSSEVAAINICNHIMDAAGNLSETRDKLLEIEDQLK